MGHLDLKEYYKLNYNLHKHHGFAISEIEGMIPFERDIYVQMVINDIEEDKTNKMQNSH